LLIFIILVIVAARVAETKVHNILGKELTVELKVLTNARANILISNVTDAISDALLFLYIDNITELEGESGDYAITRCDGSKAIITFNTSVNLPTGGMYTYITCRHDVHITIISN